MGSFTSARPAAISFTPWGYNYFRDEKFRLLEDYWNSDRRDGWGKFECDFRELKRLGANVVRIHLQFEKFIEAPGKPNRAKPGPALQGD